MATARLSGERRRGLGFHERPEQTGPIYKHAARLLPTTLQNRKRGDAMTVPTNPLPAANSRRPFRSRRFREIRCFLASLRLGFPAAVAEGGRWAKLSCPRAFYCF